MHCGPPGVRFSSRASTREVADSGRGSGPIHLGRMDSRGRLSPHELCAALESVGMDHHTVAAVSIAGTCLDVIGSLYLAYDLLGGQHGPLRLLTRAVTYSIVFGIGYGFGLGLFFGLASGIATGITLSIEFNRAARGLEYYSLPWEGMFSAIRAFGFGAGLYRIVGVRFAVAFALLITIGQILT